MKTSDLYVCQSCGAETIRWAGKCETCGEWNTLEQITRKVQKKGPGQKSASVDVSKPITFADVKTEDFARLRSEMRELDQVLGGGFVPGSVVLLSGDPGIGKSTLVLQFLDKLSRDNGVLYISGEESANQVKMRAERLGAGEEVAFLSETDVDVIINLVENEKPSLVVIDSVQTMATTEVASSMGSISQVRESSVRIIDMAKRTNTTVVLVGHVTKEGNLAGPKTLEHLVDTVLYLEGDRYHSLRILRSMKNRFGSTNESGIFEMKTEGLVEVANPSALFLSERQEKSSGSVVTAVIEGNRAFLLEIQALVTKSPFGHPKRTATGFSRDRLELLIAVLSKRAKLKLSEHDVYLNVVGGFKITEPAADIAACLAIASSLLDRPIDPLLFAIGEVGLSGEVRGVPQVEKRISEAERLGFRAAVTPVSSKVDFPGESISAATVGEAVLRAVK